MYRLNRFITGFCPSQTTLVLAKLEEADMKYAAILLILATSAAQATAVQSPNIRVFLDADPPNHVHEICPEPQTVFEVYVCFDCFGPDGGLRGAVLAFARTFGGFKLGQFNLLPDGLEIGDPEIQPGGWSFVGADCVYPDDSGIVIAASVTYLYTGQPGTLDVVPAEDQPRKTLDCLFQEDDLFCVRANLGVCVPPNPGEDCDCAPTSVQAISWGGIKGLYR
jgi:hypothetical protein